jgi:arylformamidase
MLAVRNGDGAQDLNARLRVGARDVVVDLSRPVSLARELDFHGAQPQHFGAPAATSQPYRAPGFSGSVASGASCNCEVISVIPHCNGTHTESAGHLTPERLDAERVVPPGLLPALLISVVPAAAADVSETSDPKPRPGDFLITRAAIESAWPAGILFAPQALIIRSAQAPALPYFSCDAAQAIVQHGIEHLVVDLPSLDREHDEGRLTAHRIFFGLPPGVSSLQQVKRPGATVTELAHIPQCLADGPCLLELQIPAWRGDAVPSRPLLYALLQPPMSQPESGQPEMGQPRMGQHG